MRLPEFNWPDLQNCVPAMAARRAADVQVESGWYL